jgi:hypothetical protein
MEEFPNWPTIWKEVVEAAKSCKSSLDDEVVNAVFQYFDYNVKQAFKHMNPVPNEESATVLGVLYVIGHGRLTTPECYHLTSVLGPKHIAKCWRMAVTRRRFMRKEDILNKHLMTKIYSALAVEADAYDVSISTKHTVILAAHIATLSFLEEQDSGSSADIRDFSAYFLTSEADRKSYYSRVTLAVNRTAKGSSRFDQKAYAYEMEHIVKDVLSLGELRNVGSREEVCAPMVNPVGQHMIDVPKDLKGMIITDPFHHEQIRRSSRERKIVEAYLCCGVRGVDRFLKGEEDFEECSEEDMYIYKEAMEHYEDWIHEQELDDSCALRPAGAYQGAARDDRATKRTSPQTRLRRE